MNNRKIDIKNSYALPSKLSIIVLNETYVCNNALMWLLLNINLAPSSLRDWPSALKFLLPFEQLNAFFDTER